MNFAQTFHTAPLSCTAEYTPGRPVRDRDVVCDPGVCVCMFYTPGTSLPPASNSLSLGPINKRKCRHFPMRRISMPNRPDLQCCPHINAPSPLACHLIGLLLFVCPLANTALRAGGADINHVASIVLHPARGISGQCSAPRPHRKGLCLDPCFTLMLHPPSDKQPFHATSPRGFSTAIQAKESPL